MVSDKIVKKVENLPQLTAVKRTDKLIQRVAAYARVSTDKEEQQTSIVAQKEYYTDYIKSHAGWQFVGVYADEGISGCSTKRREQFKRLISDCITSFDEPTVTASAPVYNASTKEYTTNARAVITIPSHITPVEIGYAKGEYDHYQTDEFTWLDVTTRGFTLYGNGIYTLCVVADDGQEYFTAFEVTGYTQPTLYVSGNDVTVYANLDGGYKSIAFAPGYYDEWTNAMYRSNQLKFIDDLSTTNDLEDGSYTFCIIGNDNTEYYLYITVSTLPTGTAGGSITNATNGAVLSGFTLTLIDKNSRFVSGFTTESNSSGKFTISNVSIGNYTLVATKDGYITFTTPIEVKETSAVTNYYVSMSPVLANTEYRFVLTWTAAPRDLDTHVQGVTDTSSHLYYGKKSLTGMTLDVDKTSGYGPETVTVDTTTLAAGTYKYYIYDYTNRSSTTSLEMSNSTATITVYNGSTIAGTYIITPNTRGRYWNVLRFVWDGTTFTINEINTVTNSIG